MSIRLDSYIAQKCNISRSKAQKLIQNKQVKLFGESVIDNDHVVKPDQEYTVHFIQPEVSTSIEPNLDIKLNIVYEDEDIIILNKQSGLTVHPGAGTNNDTLLNAVVAYLPHNNPYIVHRLDKDTSGLMVVAKNEKSHSFFICIVSKARDKA